LTASVEVAAEVLEQQKFYSQIESRNSTIITSITAAGEVHSNWQQEY
jgi:hypothetical protein